MPELAIEFDRPDEGRAPGGEVTGVVRYRLDRPADRLEVNLYWYTEGKGTRDDAIVAQSVVERPPLAGEAPFRFRLPDAPWSFSGRLVSLVWAVGAVVHPGRASASRPFTVAPGGREIRLRDILPVR